MPRLSDTIERLAAMRRTMSRGPNTGADDRLQELPWSGRNPGNLRARIHMPANLVERPALVVVLHGCTQTAAGYDLGSGWSQLADENGFVVLFPEQQRANNPNLCFNWFSPKDTRRDMGEALSIREMVAAAVEAHGIDPSRVYVTGLSAGGAMTSVMLATYPEIFAGGAIIAGLPYGAASGIPQALERMRGQGGPDTAALGTLVLDASDHRGPWPTVSIWHGSADATVSPLNAEAILAQWRTVHELPEQPTSVDVVQGFPHRAWRDASGRWAIEDYAITGMGHGTPLDTRGKAGRGTAGAYMLDVGISSTHRIAEAWGLIGKTVAASAAPSPEKTPAPVIAVAAAVRLDPIEPERTTPENGIAKIIDDALRSAGLVR